MLWGVETDSVFDEVADALRSMVSGDLGVFHERAHRYGIKCWFGPAQPPKEHYEAQVIAPRGVKGAKVLALEIGFHAEYAKERENVVVIDHLLEHEKGWRKGLGREAVVGPFLGRTSWRRISETWPDPDLEDGALVIEIAMRLVDYLNAIEPVRASRNVRGER
jgi:hypothetical protein